MWPDRTYDWRVRIVIVADVHANLLALQAVFAEAETGGSIDQVWSLGDMVGYGAEPRQTLELLKSYPLRAIAGNHDLAATGAVSTDDFNPFAAEAAHWTSLELSGGDKAWIDALPHTLIEGEFTLAHGTLKDPVWEYLMDSEQAAEHLAVQTTPYGLVGHTHVPMVYVEDEASEAREESPDDGALMLGPRRFVCNVGSVGQPRDGDPRAAYGLLDTSERSLAFCRVEYDVEATQAKIVEAGLPAYLAKRLSHGR
jgi:diadenosine tetraphosphatase ApaH/serine/threonine PP2A family protein phosphatase